MIRKFSMATAVLMAASASALAADLPSRRPPPPAFVPVPLFTWSGIYVGGQIGYAWGADHIYVPTFGDFSSITPNGEIGGAHIGYNYQISQFVIGVEGDVNGSNFQNTAPGVLGTGYRTRIPVEGSARGRIGFAWDRVLFFATGGAAFADIDNSYFGGPVTGAGAYFDNSKSRVGWTVGGGVEYALSNNWSVRGEYRYSDFGHQTDFLFGTGALPQHHVTQNAVTVGFSYKFDMYAPPAPVVAKY